MIFGDGFYAIIALLYLAAASGIGAILGLAFFVWTWFDKGISGER